MKQRKSTHVPRVTAKPTQTHTTVVTHALSLARVTASPTVMTHAPLPCQPPSWHKPRPAKPCCQLGMPKYASPRTDVVVHAYTLNYAQVVHAYAQNYAQDYAQIPPSFLFAVLALSGWYLRDSWR